MWDLGGYDFIEGDAPPSVNPSLWRQAKLNLSHGLFEVVPGIYQVRGYDISNITFISSNSGWIVVDPLTIAETARAARGLVDEQFGRLPIVAVIYTHSHGDHYGGIRGIVDDDEVASGAVRIVAPEGFLEAAVSENVTAGPAMNRRGMYMFGVLLPTGPLGHVDAGLGKTVPIFGDRGLIAPTELIDESGTVLTNDETMRLANHGHTPLEIAEMIEVPRAITDEWFNRDYYGTINHNVKAVYQRYLGWFDGNPANRAARYLQADALEQLGFQAESGPWRAFYLTGAQELRNGAPQLPGLRGSVSVDVMRAMTATMVLDHCAVKLNGPRAADHACSFTVEFTDRAEAYDVVMFNGVLRHRTSRGSADTTVRASVQTFIHLTSELVSADEAMSSGSLEISGPLEPFTTFVSLLDQFDIFFPIIEP